MKQKEAYFFGMLLFKGMLYFVLLTGTKLQVCIFILYSPAGMVFVLNEQLCALSIKV